LGYKKTAIARSGMGKAPDPAMTHTCRMKAGSLVSSELIFLIYYLFATEAYLSNVFVNPTAASGGVMPLPARMSAGLILFLP